MDAATTAIRELPALEEFSVLRSANTGKVQNDPYPYLVEETVFDQDLYQRLERDFPADKLFFQNMSKIENNQAVRIGAAEVINNPSFSDEWRAFFEWHTSEGFWRDIMRVFGPSIRAEFPQLEKQIGRPMEEWRVKRRGDPGEADISLDLLFVINTPVTKESSVRPAHVDRKNKIFSGLFYMKQPNDPTPGGDLSLYRFKPGRDGFGGHYTELSDVDEVATVPYGANKFIAFVNSGRAIHGVTPRPVTEWTRRYINFVVETPMDAFALKPLPLLRRIAASVKRRQSKSSGVDLRLPPPD